MINIRGKNLPEAYHLSLRFLNDREIIPCPDYNTTMKEIQMAFTVDNATAEPMISRMFPGGHHELQQYLMEVRDGILDFMVGADKNVWEYTYHQRISNQLDFIYQELKRNPYSRRAVIDVRDNDVDQHTDHPACLQHIQFFIRDGKLNMTVLMRSNDAVNATFMNAFAFINGIQEPMARKLEIDIGSYTHIANSYHVYQKDFDKLYKYIEAIENRSPKELTYRYNGYYDYVMYNEIPFILMMVKEQHEKYFPGK